MTSTFTVNPVQSWDDDYVCRTPVLYSDVWAAAVPSSHSWLFPRQKDRSPPFKDILAGGSEVRETTGKEDLFSS